MLLAHRVSVSTAAQGKGGHVKALRLGRIHSQAEELISGEIQCGQVRAEVLVHQLIGKDIMACWNGRVCGEDRGAADLLEGIAVAHSSLYLLPNPLQDGKSRMALVAMKNGIVHTQMAQDAHAANAQGLSPGAGAAPDRRYKAGRI